MDVFIINTITTMMLIFSASTIFLVLRDAWDKKPNRRHGQALATLVLAIATGLFTAIAIDLNANYLQEQIEVKACLKVID